MAILIKQATVLDKNSEFAGKKVDILIDGGKITEIKKSISPKANCKVIEGDELFVSNGWMDMQSVFCDPVLEHNRERIKSCSSRRIYKRVRARIRSMLHQ